MGQEAWQQYHIRAKQFRLEDAQIPDLAKRVYFHGPEYVLLMRSDDAWEGVMLIWRGTVNVALKITIQGSESNEEKDYVVKIARDISAVIMRN
jgi:hypothetical protein